MKIHIVQKGDTLWKIAKKYGVNFEELKKMNSQLSNPDMIMPGMKIKVPTSGGSVKKEAPISMGAKKEMPIAEAPLVKEQPIVQAPIKEAPVMPIKEAPIMPIKEAPKVTYTPKMPQPVIPDIDINNYYMLNMANMNVQQPQLPPKPTNILPEVKEVPKEIPKAVAPVQEAPPKAVAPAAESPELPIQGGFEQPMYPEYCVPVSPILPGSGLQPGLYPPQPFLPYQQPAAMPYQPYPTAVSPTAMPYQPVPTAVSPAAMPAGTNPTYLAGMEDESSSFMPQMPMMNPMSQNPTAVMGAQSPQPMPMAPAGFAPAPYAPMADNCVPASPVLPGSGLGPVPTPYAGAPYGYPQQPWPIRTQQMPQDDQQMQMQMPQMQMPMQQMPQMPYGGGQQMSMQQMPYDVGQQMQMPQMPYGGQQMQMPQMPYGGGQQMPMQQMPYGGQQVPMQQMMPHGGGQMPMQQIPYGGQQMPMQQMMPYGGGQMQMPHMQAGYPTMESPEDFGMEQYPTVGMAEDCGCGAPTFPTSQVNPYVTAPGVYSPMYGGQMVQPPYMNPYAFGAGSVPAPRVFDESSEYDR